MQQNPSQAFIQWLEKKISEAEQPRRLPTVRQLSGQFGISHTTLTKLISPYRVRGLVTAIRGKGMYTGRLPCPDDEPQPPKSSAEEIADSIEKEIFSGMRKHAEQLPQLKSICGEYHVSMSTCVAAYRVLRRRGRICKRGKSFFVGQEPDTVSHTPRHEMVLFSPPDRQQGTLFAEPPFSAAYLEMERELLVHNILLELCSLDEFERMAAQWLDALKDGKSGGRPMPRGIIFSSVTYEAHHRYIGAIRRFMKASAPRSPAFLICGNTGGPNRDRNMQVFMYGSVYTVQARRIAEYIASAGIRSVQVFFDSRTQSDKDFLALDRLWHECLRQNPSCAFTHGIATGGQPFDLQRFLEEPVSERKAMKGSVRRHVENMLRSKKTASTYQTFLETLVVEESFEQCCRTAPAPALWVFPFAKDAEAALQWCGRKRVAVPKTVSIIALQSSPVCIRSGISSCIEDWQTIGYQMAHALIGDIPVSRTRRGYLRLRARLLERRTTQTVA